jgi:hypothetical protein
MPQGEIGFFAKHLDPGERMGELLFGLIMTLTFTLTAGFVVGEDRGAVRELLVATIGCNIAWGIIDAGLLVLGRVFERGRLKRLGLAIRRTTTDAGALAAVSDELDETLEPLASEEMRKSLYREVVRTVRTGTQQSVGVRGEDWLAALVVFFLVFFSSLPAALPFLFIDEPWTALRVSNGILLALLFFIGYRWAGYTNVRPWRAAVSMTALGLVLVATAIALGG